MDSNFYITTPPIFFSQRHQIPILPACSSPIQINRRHYQWQSLLLFQQSLNFTLLPKFIGRFSHNRTIFLVCLTLLYVASKNYIHREFLAPLIDWNVHTWEKKIDDVSWQKWGPMMQKFESILQFSGFHSTSPKKKIIFFPKSRHTKQPLLKSLNMF